MISIAQFYTKALPRDDLALTAAVLEDLHENLSRVLSDLSDNQRTFLPNDLVPSTASDKGTPGQIAYDSDYIYVCVAANTWRRAALSTW